MWLRLVPVWNPVQSYTPSFRYTSCDHWIMSDGQYQICCDYLFAGGPAPTVLRCKTTTPVKLFPRLSDFGWVLAQYRHGPPPVLLLEKHTPVEQSHLPGRDRSRDLVNWTVSLQSYSTDQPQLVRRQPVSNAITCTGNGIRNAWQCRLPIVDGLARYANILDARQTQEVMDPILCGCRISLPVHYSVFLEDALLERTPTVISRVLWIVLGCCFNHRQCFSQADCHSTIGGILDSASCRTYRLYFDITYSNEPVLSSWTIDR